jgi:hypothetical protein
MTPGTAAPIIYASGAVKTLNSKPAASFSSANSQYLTSSVTANPVNTLYVNSVIQVNSTSVANDFCGTSGAGNSFLTRVDVGGNIDVLNAGVTSIGVASNAVTAGVASVVEAEYNSTTGAFGIWIDRVNGAGPTASAQTLNSGNLQLGAYANAAEKYDGFIGEFISYDLVGGIPGASQTSIENNQKAYWGTP